ncbi:Pin-related site-specific recombinase/DNA invertase [Streptococcus iniae]|nr:Pin-related site-specific recombinase/DNA invertase [Streptococcus iniae]
MSRIGYIRVSSHKQNFDRQYNKLLSETDKIFSDKESGKSKERKALKEMLEYIREDDIVIVTELDRLGRNNTELTEIMNEITKAGATLEILNLPSLKGVQDKNLRLLLNNLILELYKYQAEEERMRIRERQQQGIEIAKRKGKYKGKPPKYKSNDPRLLHAFDLFKQNYSDREIEKMTGINTRTFRRYRQKYNIYRNK